MAIRNAIYNPKHPLFLLTDTSAVESSVFICNWNPDDLTLNIVGTKSSLLTTSMRRQSPVHREAVGLRKVIDLAKPYLIQTVAPVNYLFTDASSLSYINRLKHFNSFLQDLSEELSLYPTITVIHTPGSVLFYPDLISRQLDNIHLPREGVQISKQQALIIPSLQ